MKRATRLLAAALLSLSILTAGCQNDSPAGPGAGSDELGTVMLALSGDVAGYQIDVVADAGGATVASRFVAVAGGATVQSLFALAPGGYTVRATPSKSPGVPEPSCMPASSHADVEKGRTAQVVLI